MTQTIMPIAAPAQAADPGTLVMTRYTIRDGDRNGRQPCFHALVPQGWRAESAVQWTLGSIACPVAVWARFTAPGGAEAVEFLPVAQGLLSYSPMGVTGAAPARDVVEALTAQAAAARPHARLRVVDARAERCASTPAGYLTTAHEQAGAVVVVYEEAGRAVEEEFAGTLTVHAAELGPGYGTRRWFLHSTRAVKAPRGGLARLRPVGVAMARGLQATPEFALAADAAGQCAANVAAHDIEATRRDLENWRAANQQVTDAWRQTVAERWAAQDRVAEGRSDVLGGVSRFVSAAGETVLLPVSHQYAWEDPASGLYVLTNDPGYRPDADLRGDWSRLQPKG